MGYLHGRRAQLLPLSIPTILLLALGLPATVRGQADPFWGRIGVSPALRTALERQCGEDRQCVAAQLTRRLPARYRLEPAPPPDSDRIRWVRSTSSIAAAAELPGGRLMVELVAFSRTLFAEWRRRIPHGAVIVLDLRRHPGGDLERMLALAAALLGRTVALAIRRPDGGVQWLHADPPPLPAVRVAAVLVGPDTASSAEILASLLARAGVPLCGSRTRGKTSIEAVVPVSQGWRLRVFLGEAAIGGAAGAGPIVPDRPAARCLEARPIDAGDGGEEAAAG